MHHTHRRVRWCPRIAVVLVVLAAGVTACAAPSGGGTVTQGYHSGEISILNSPITYTYDGVAGQDLNLYHGLASDSDPGTTLTLVAPDGNAVVPIERRPGPTDRFILPTTGRYTIRLAYPTVDTQVRRYTLGVSRDEDRGATGLGPLGPTLVGQRVTYHYAGTAGERLNRYLVDRVVAPDGTVVGDNGLRSSQVTLTLSGDHRIEVTNSVAVLSQDLPAIAATLGRVDLPPLLQGQHIDLTYPGAADEAVGVGFGSNVSVDVRRSDWSPIPATPSARGSRFVIPGDDTIRVVVTGQPFGDPQPSAVWLSHDLELGVVGEGLFATPSRLPGQSIRLVHDRPLGGAFRLRTFDPPGTKPAIRVSGPSGLTLTGAAATDPSLPGDPWTTYTPVEAGSHSIMVVPTLSPGTGTISIEIDDLP